ncbi:MAG: Magnesium and cobalt efflux protein CorC [Pseudomonadota bacterium]
MDVLLLVALILLNGLFALSEIALVTARRGRLQKLAEEGDSGAELAIRLGSDPNRFLSTVQIGLTAITILNGIVGESVFAEPLAEWLTLRGLEASTSSWVATTLVVVIITYLTIVFGELVPKRVGSESAETIARLVARPIALLATMSRPVVALLSLSTEAVLRLLGKRGTEAEITEDDIHAILVEGSESGIIQKHEHDMVRKVFQLEDRPISSLMTPRSEIDWLDTTQPLSDNLDKVLASTHSRFPVCTEALHNMLGVISAKRLLLQCLQGETTDITENLQPAVFVPESVTGMMVLDQFRNSGVSVVFVVDEYGEILGLVTLQDVLEALAGEFKSRDPREDWAVQRADGSWLLDGLIPLPELKDRLGMRTAPEEEKGHYNTLSGMMMQLLGDVPTTGATTDWENWHYEIVDMDGNRVDKVLASRHVDDSG